MLLTYRESLGGLSQKECAVSFDDVLARALRTGFGAHRGELVETSTQGALRRASRNGLSPKRAQHGPPAQRRQEASPGT